MCWLFRNVEILTFSFFKLRVGIVKTSDGSSVQEFDLPKISFLEISPQNKVLATWQQYASEFQNYALISRNSRSHEQRIQSVYMEKSFFFFK